jgi:hypothetical protein
MYLHYNKRGQNMQANITHSNTVDVLMVAGKGAFSYTTGTHPEFPKAAKLLFINCAVAPKALDAASVAAKKAKNQADLIKIARRVWTPDNEVKSRFSHILCKDTRQMRSFRLLPRTIDILEGLPNSQSKNIENALDAVHGEGAIHDTIIGLRSALNYYADQENYGAFAGDMAVEIDRGDLARRALAGLNELSRETNE